MSGRFPLATASLPLHTGNFSLTSGKPPLTSGNVPLNTKSRPLTTGKLSLNTGNFPLTTGKLPLASGNFPVVSGKLPHFYGKPALQSGGWSEEWRDKKLISCVNGVPRRCLRELCRTRIAPRIGGTPAAVRRAGTENRPPIENFHGGREAGDPSLHSESGGRSAAAP